MRRLKLPERRPQTAPDTALSIVNLVLLLILFFLATGSLLNAPNYGVNLAETGELPISLLPQPILIIDDEAGMLLDGVPIDAAGLAEAMNAEPVLHVLAPRDAAAQRLLALFAEEALLATEIRLVTLHVSPEDGL